MFKIPEIIMPGVERNDLYLTLEECELSEKNVEVTCYLRHNSAMDTTTAVLLSKTYLFTNKDFMTSASSDKMCHIFRGLVLSNSNPRWKETLHMRFPVDSQAKVLKDSHIFFEIRHCATTDNGSQEFY